MPRQPPAGVDAKKWQEAWDRGKDALDAMAEPCAGNALPDAGDQVEQLHDAFYALVLLLPPERR